MRPGELRVMVREASVFFTDTGTPSSTLFPGDLVVVIEPGESIVEESFVLYAFGCGWVHLFHRSDPILINHQ